MPLKKVNVSYKSIPRIAAQTTTHKFAIFPAPTKGLDSSRPLVAQDPMTATQLNNWWCRKWGPELRGGYRRWATNIGGVGSEAPINTLMPYRPSLGPAGTFVPKLFAAAGDGNIYDVSAQSNEAAVPAAVQNIPNQTLPGRFSYVNYAIAGVNYLCVVGKGGGYWTYNDAAGWVDRTAALTGAIGVPIQFDFIMVWKRRLWFIQANTGQAYFLPVDVVQGAVSLFDFGPLLQHGGELSVLASWTVDSGDGIDDKFVVIGSEGDVLIYAGTDPTSATTFALQGRWWVGKVPIGRRFVTDSGGDLAIVTQQGVEYISKVQEGRGLLNPEVVRDTPAFRYNEVIGREVRRTDGQSFWSIMYHPGEESMIVTTPSNTVANALQFIFAVLGTAWSTFTGLPMVCAAAFDGDLYFGTGDGRICQAFTSNTDDELSDGTVGLSIIGDVQTAYVTDPENPMSLKRPQLIMPMFQAPGAPALVAQVNSEWSTTGTAGSPSFTGGGGSLWQSGLWNTAIWGTAEQAFFAWLGATGLGCYFSLRMSVVGLPGTIFTSWKLVYEPGGIM